MNSTLTTSGTVDVRPSFAQFSILRVVTGWYDPLRFPGKHDGPNEKVQMSLYECDLAWCLKTYGTATVVNGVLAESAPTESTFHTTTVNWSNMQDPDCVSNLEGIHYKTFGGQQLHNSQWKVFDECPDVMGIAREKDLYIVNFEDEVTVK